MGKPILIRLIDPCCPPPRKLTNYKVYILVFTFLIYTSYHLSKKPLSVVKTVLFDNCTRVAHKQHLTIGAENATFCDWLPFTASNAEELLGDLDFIFLLTYAVFMFFSGYVAERVNIRHYVGVGLILVGLSTGAFGLAFFLRIHRFYYFAVIQFVCGLVQVTGWPSVVTCLTNWFGKSKRGLLMGLWNSHTSLGNILGSVIAGAFVEWNWGLSFAVPGFISVALGLVVLVALVPYPEEVDCIYPNRLEFLEKSGPQNDEESLARNSPSKCNIRTAKNAKKIENDVINNNNNYDDFDDGEVNTHKTEQSRLITASNDAMHRSKLNNNNDDYENDENINEQQMLSKSWTEMEKVSIWRALRIPGVIEFSLCLFFAKFVAYTFLYWLPQYIKTTGHFSPTESADLSSIFDVGGILGGVLAGALSDLTEAPGCVCFASMLCVVPIIALVYEFSYVTLTNCIVLLIFAGVFVNGPYALITTAVSAQLGTHKVLRANANALATVTAIIDGTGSLGATLGPKLTGSLLHFGWEYIFIMLGGASALSGVFVIRIVANEIRDAKRKSRSQTAASDDNDDDGLIGQSY